MMAARALSARPWWQPYIGLPFGDGPGEITCWGLFRRIYAEQLGIDLPAYGEISCRDLLRITRAMEAGKDDGWRVPAVPAAFDGVLLRAPGGGTRVAHVGVLVDPGHLIHVEEATHSVVVPLAHWTVDRRILGFRRRAG